MRTFGFGLIFLALPANAVEPFSYDECVLALGKMLTIELAITAPLAERLPSALRLPEEHLSEYLDAQERLGDQVAIEAKALINAFAEGCESLRK